MPKEISTKQHFDLSELSYQDVGQIDSSELNGWEIVDHNENPETGYYGIAFKSPDGQIVIAHRGSESPVQVEQNPIKIITGGILKINPDWGESDLAIAQQRVPPQYHDANDFTQNIMNEHGNNVIHTGHSLGGALAQLATQQNGGHAVAFDPPGTREVIENSNLFDNEIDETKFESILVKNSPVSAINSQIGDLNKIDLNQGSTNVNPMGHMMGNIGKAFDPISGSIREDYLLNMSTITESTINRLVDDPIDMAKGYVADKIQDVGDAIVDGAELVGDTIVDGIEAVSDFFDGPEIIEEQDTATEGMDSIDGSNIATELEANMNALYENLDQFAAAVSSI